MATRTVTAVVTGSLGGHHTQVLTTDDGKVTTGIFGQPVRQFRIEHGLGPFVTVSVYDDADSQHLFPGPEITFLDRDTMLLGFDIPDAEGGSNRRLHAGNDRVGRARRAKRVIDLVAEIASKEVEADDE